MTDHLPLWMLNALVDGELSNDQLRAAKEHLDTCPPCTSNALNQVLLKTATSRAGQRYDVQPEFQQRIEDLISRQVSKANTQTPDRTRPPHHKPARNFALTAWGLAALLLVLLASSILVQHHTRQLDITSTQEAALITEVSDLHIAALAANSPPQVISSDRHTVKPWFQGKLPFSFNLPENLPADTKLDGANLVYLRDQPVAQLLYSIGRHHVSVFIRQRKSVGPSRILTDRAGFQIASFHTDDLEGIAVSDVDPARLSGLVAAIEQAQRNVHQ